MIDFLRFLTSQEGSQMFTSISHWQPATIGAKPSHFAAQFTQETEGNAWGPSFINLSGTDAGQFMRGQLGALWNVGGSVEAYRAAVRPGLASRLREDYGREERAARLNVCNEDTIAAARRQLAPETLPVPPIATVPNEAKIYQIRDVLATERTR